MRREELKELCAEAAGILARLNAALGAALEESDPFVLHLYRSRKRYRKVALECTNKSGRPIEREIWRSFEEAGKEGFCGTFQQWEALLLAKRR